MYQSNSPVITPKQNQDAQILSSKLGDAIGRKRAYVDFTGAMVAVDFIKQRGIRTNIEKSVFKCSKLYSDFQIVDIYPNSHSIYVITSYGTDTVKIPAIHKNYNILPEAYIAVELKIGMKQAEVIGVIYPEDLTEDKLEGRAYKFLFKDLKPSSSLIEKLKKYAGIKPSIGRHLDCMNLFVPYIEGTIEENDKIRLIEHVLTCESCKKRLIETIEFDSKAKNIKEHNNIFTKTDLSSKVSFLKKIHEETKSNEENLQGAIDVIYQDNNLRDLEKESFEYKPNISKGILKIVGIAVLTFTLLTLCTALIISIPKKNSAENKTVQGNVIDENYTDKNNNVLNLDIPTTNENKHKGYTSVSKVSWEVASDIKDDNTKNFLQQAGKSIKLNLQNDLLLSNEASITNRVKFDIRFLRDGSLDEVEVSKSSGSDVIDDVIKQSIENTLHYMRPPKGTFVGNNSGLTLVVDF